MFRVIYPNRYLVWTIVLVSIMALLLWGAIERFGIEQEALSIQPFSFLPKPHQSLLDTSTWKTYRNDKYGYTIMYPVGWSVMEAERSNKTSSTTRFLLNNAIQSQESGEVQTVEFSEQNNKSNLGLLGVNVLVNPSNFSLKDWWEAQLKNSDSEQEKCKQKIDEPCLSLRGLLRGEKNTTLGGHEALRVKVFGFDNMVIQTMAASNGFVYEVTYQDFSFESNNDLNQKIYKDMVASFKFLATH